MTQVRYSLSCENKHVARVSPDGLGDALSGGTCPKCDGQVVRTNPAVLSVRCVPCQTETSGSWNELVWMFNEGCPVCRSNDGTGGRLVVTGSIAAEISDYEEMQVRKEKELEARPTRADYWEYLIHFCTPKQFESILRDRAIYAAKTGYFKVPAVCLTDAPVAFTKELEARHGSCGFVFRKTRVLKEGGGPAVYLSPAVLEAQKRAPGFSEELRPFVNIVRTPKMSGGFLKPYDWLHEREWRLAKDIEFEEMAPEAVVLPRRSAARFNVFNSPIRVIEAARLYGELVRPSPDGRSAGSAGGN